MLALNTRYFSKNETKQNDTTNHHRNQSMEEDAVKNNNREVRVDDYDGDGDGEDAQQLFCPEKYSFKVKKSPISKCYSFNLIFLLQHKWHR